MDKIVIVTSQSGFDYGLIELINTVSLIAMFVLLSVQMRPLRRLRPAPVVYPKREGAMAKVLIVDDQPYFRELLSKELILEGY